jgi:hypothetical protein
VITAGQNKRKKAFFIVPDFVAATNLPAEAALKTGQLANSKKNWLTTCVRVKQYI